MKIATTVLMLLLSSSAFAGVKFSFQNEELIKIIDAYSKLTGQKFVVDPSLVGRGTILGADDVPIEEAFNLLSSALATNGFAISKQGDTMVVRSARNVQRDLIEVTNTLPALKPERMVSYVYFFKNVPATQVMRDIRIFASKDGELVVNASRNQMIVTDWASNVHRIDQLFKQVDAPQDPKTAKLVEALNKEQQQASGGKVKGKKASSNLPPPPESRLPEQKEAKD